MVPEQLQPYLKRIWAVFRRPLASGSMFFALVVILIQLANATSTFTAMREFADPIARFLNTGWGSLVLFGCIVICLDLAARQGAADVKRERALTETVIADFEQRIEGRFALIDRETQAFMRLRVLQLVLPQLRSALDRLENDFAAAKDGVSKAIAEALRREAVEARVMSAVMRLQPTVDQAAQTIIDTHPPAKPDLAEPYIAQALHDDEWIHKEAIPASVRSKWARAVATYKVVRPVLEAVIHELEAELQKLSS